MAFWAQTTLADEVHHQSKQQTLTLIEGDGYEFKSFSRTFLGRFRFISYKGTTRRETIINPNSGEVLADYFVENYDFHRANQAANEAKRQADDNNGTRNDSVVETNKGSEVDLESLIQAGTNWSGEGY